MRSLLLPDSLRILESLTFTKTLYAFDFDGTLSKIVRHPADASLTPKTIRLLKTLTQLVPVAIISGRSLPDLKSRLACTPKYLIGNHGLEGDGALNIALENTGRACRTWQEKLAKIRFVAGIEIENKSYSIAIHYRQCRQKKQARAQIQTALDDLRPAPRIIVGKSVFNLLPEGAPHKGMAVLNLMKNADLKNGFYIGDDDTDEDVFSLPEARYQIMTVRVGKKLSSQARYYLDRQTEVNRLLELLIRFYKPTHETRLLAEKR